MARLHYPHPLRPDGDLRTELTIAVYEGCLEARGVARRGQHGPRCTDTLHHFWNTSGERIKDAVERCGATWTANDGIQMVDYSSPDPGGRPGKHAQSIDIADFSAFVAETAPLDFDVMLEIKDKEHSALKAIDAVSGDPRFIGGAFH